MNVSGLGCNPFAHHYLGHLVDFFYVRLLRCFTSPTLPPIGFLDYSRRVAPFGYLRIDNCLRFPVTFRRLLRPSSLSDATGIPRMLLTYLFFHFIAALYFIVNMLRVICLLTLLLVEMIGFEPTTYGLQSHRSPTEPHPHVLKWWAEGDSNLRPRGYQPRALTN